MSKRILHIATNVGQYDNGDPTGLWLSGLTTAWDRFEREGCEQDIASPRGGDVPLDPRSLKFPFRNESAKSWLNNPERMALLKNTPPIRSVDPNTYDAVCLAGGH
ncbi:MAG: type 1 glutamine amidotransferase domain-containing protein, partial [Rothia dentocariosa]